LKTFELSLQLQGFPIQKAKGELEKILSFSAKEKAVWVEKKRMEMVQFHWQNNPFYQKHIGAFPKEWSQIPILTKAHLQLPLEKRLSRGFTLKNCYINKTSGSSGTPFVFAIDKFSHAMTWANTMHLFGAHGIDFNRDLQARFYGIPLDFFGYQKEKLKDFLANRYRFPVFDLSDVVLEKYLQTFRKKKFVYLNGYTNSMLVFAQFLLKKQLVLKEVCPTLKAVFTTSEMLFPEDQITMQQAFGVPVINEYGASELGIIAMDQPKTSLAINTNTLLVEVVDENNQAVKAGVEGRVLVTSLFNHAHPMIRYEIGDIAFLNSEGNGIQQLVGRTNDMAVLPSGKKIPGLTFYYVTKGIISDRSPVKEFVIFQEKLTLFKIQYVSDFELEEVKIKEIHQLMATYLEPGLEVVLERVGYISRSASGKLKQFISIL
jgi:phenylacetate-CoA ligase